MNEIRSFIGEWIEVEIITLSRINKTQEDSLYRHTHKHIHTHNE